MRDDLLFIAVTYIYTISSPTMILIQCSSTLCLVHFTRYDTRGVTVVEYQYGS